MNQRQLNILSMVKGLIAHFNKYPKAYENEPLVKAAFFAVVTLYQKAEALSPKQAMNTVGYTEKKDDLYEAMVEMAHKIARKITMYAKSKKDAVLLNLVDYTRSGLEAGTETEVVNRCIHIVESAQNHLAELGGFKVRQADIDALKEILEAFKKAPGERNQVGSERKTATAGILDVIKAITDSLDELDDAVYTQIEEDEDFVETYRNMRKVGSRGMGKTGPRSESKAVPKNENPTDQLLLHP